jgi:hypothetical protein
VDVKALEVRSRDSRDVMNDEITTPREGMKREYEQEVGGAKEENNEEQEEEVEAHRARNWQLKSGQTTQATRSCTILTRLVRR